MTSLVLHDNHWCYNCLLGTLKDKSNYLYWQLGSTYVDIDLFLYYCWVFGVFYPWTCTQVKLFSPFGGKYSFLQENITLQTEEFVLAFVLLSNQKPLWEKFHKKKTIFFFQTTFLWSKKIKMQEIPARSRKWKNLTLLFLDSFGIACILLLKAVL